MLQLAPATDAAQRLRGFADFPDVGEVVYELVRSGSGGLVAEARQADEVERWRWPFVKPSGPNSPQLGPILTRMSGENFSPKLVIVQRTLALFAEIAGAGLPHSHIFRHALDVVGDDAGAVRSALAAIKARGSVLVSLGPPPGNDVAFVDYLLAQIDTDGHGTCACCARADVPLLSDGLKSLAKLNLFNRDRGGAFPGLAADHVGHRFAICADCGLALRRFKIEVTPTLKCRVGGQPALVIPHITGEDPIRAKSRALAVVERMQEGDGVDGVERRLLTTLAREEALCQFHILWAIVGDSLDDVDGLVTDVPSTRLQQLSRFKQQCESECSPILGGTHIELDLHFGFLDQALKAPGGKRVEKLNEGASRRAFVREVAAAAFESRRIDPRGLAANLERIGRAHVAMARDGWGWLIPSKGRTAWARQVAVLLHFLRLAGVLDMSGSAYVPASARLRPFFQDAAGLDTPAKSFAFLLGVLHAKLMSIQAARRVRVESNALTWLKGGNLSGRDLPALYAQTRTKLLEYGTSSEAIRDVEGELALLGTKLGAPIPLDGPTALYFLMLGESMQPEILPANAKTEETPQ